MTTLPCNERPGDLSSGSPLSLDDSEAPDVGGSSELQVAANPELGRLLVSKLVEFGDRVDDMLGDSSLDEADDFVFEFASDVLMRFRP